MKDENAGDYAGIFLMRRLMLCLLLFCAAPAGAVDIQFKEIPRAVIESRLRLAPGKNKEREPGLRELFEQERCPQLSEQPVKHVKAPNLICSVPGSLESIIVVGAHFDFVDLGAGVLDNWSGAAILPSLLESLQGVPRRHRFIFIGFTAEEQGLIGSKFYVQNLTPEQRNQIHAMVNLDSLGASPTKFEQTRADKQLTGALTALAHNMSLPASIVNVHNVGRSDADSFQDARIPAIVLHSVTTETWPILHSNRDQLSAVHIDDYYDTFRLIAAYLAYLDQILDQPLQ
jgi:hypothetical protein